MRKIAAILLLATALFGGVKWQEEYKDALALAKKEHKILYVFISAGECPWCHKFLTKTLTQKPIYERLNQDYININLVRDFDEIPSQFATRPVPRHYFVDNSGKIIYEDLGYFDAEIFSEILNHVDKLSKKEKK